MDSYNNIHIVEEVSGNENLVPLQENFIFTSSSSGREKKIRIIHTYMG